MAASLSGSVAFSPPTNDLTIEAYARIGIRPAAFTQDHMQSARMSFNLVNSIFSNRGTNLWRVALQQITLPQGVSTYPLDASTIMILPEAFIRTYTLSNETSLEPEFTTSIGSTTVSIYQPSHGLSVDSWLNMNVYVGVGGIVIYGFYQVVTVPDADNYTITIADAATAVEVGGVVPQYLVFEGSTVAQVILPKHGFGGGETFNANVQTTAGGIAIYGPYVIQSIVDADTFLITLQQAAITDDTVYENDGLVQILTQSTTALPVDRVIYPLSRADWSAIPNKSQQALPTSYWFDRLINPTITVWPVPDDNGPYQLNFYRFVQMEDVNIRGDQLADVPFRFLESFTAAVAAHLAMKWKPEMFQMLQEYSDRMFKEASDADRERVPFFVVPTLQGYYST